MIEYENKCLLKKLCRFFRPQTRSWFRFWSGWDIFIKKSK